MSLPRKGKPAPGRGQCSRGLGERSRHGERFHPPGGTFQKPGERSRWPGRTFQRPGGTFQRLGGRSRALLRRSPFRGRRSPFRGDVPLPERSRSPARAGLAPRFPAGLAVAAGAPSTSQALDLEDILHLQLPEGAMQRAAVRLIPQGTAEIALEEFVPYPLQGRLDIVQELSSLKLLALGRATAAGSGGSSRGSGGTGRLAGWARSPPALGHRGLPPSPGAPPGASQCPREALRRAAAGAAGTRPGSRRSLLGSSRSRRVVPGGSGRKPPRWMLSRSTWALPSSASRRRRPRP